MDPLFKYKPSICPQGAQVIFTSQPAANAEALKQFSTLALSSFNCLLVTARVKKRAEA